MAAQRTVEANISAARHADVASAAAADNKAAASAARRSYGVRANETGGVGYGDGAPRGNEARARDDGGPTHGRQRSGSGCVDNNANDDDGASPR
jgi:hypothetical protein